MKTCPSCGEQVEGRIDKKFCSSYCKSSFHYIKNRDQKGNRYMAIDLQLKLNRRILKGFNTH
ncbi:MAG: hypothetical protein AAF363_08310 [Bacteroidota bacterium]